MSDDKERRDQALVPQSTSELTTRSTGLVRRGLNDLRNSQSRLNSSDAGKVPRLKTGTKVYTTDGIPGEIVKSRSSDEGPVYTLAGSPKVEGRDWKQDELTKFDKARYAQGKALFQSAMKHFASEGKTPIEQMAGLVNALRTTFAIPDATMKAMKPDVLRFMGELVDEQAKQAGNKPSEHLKEQAAKLDNQNLGPWGLKAQRHWKQFLPSLQSSIRSGPRRCTKRGKRAARPR